MARVCDICGKTALNAVKFTRRGAPKRRGGAGRKITGKSKRRQYPNLQRMRVMRGPTPARVRVCARCLRSGRIEKPASG